MCDYFGAKRLGTNMRPPYYSVYWACLSACCTLYLFQGLESRWCLINVLSRWSANSTPCCWPGCRLSCTVEWWVGWPEPSRVLPEVDYYPTALHCPLSSLSADDRPWPAPGREASSLPAVSGCSHSFLALFRHWAQTSPSPKHSSSVMEGVHRVCITNLCFGCAFDLFFKTRPSLPQPSFGSHSQRVCWWGPRLFTKHDFPYPSSDFNTPPPNTHTCIFSFMRKYGKRADFIFRNYHFSKFFLLTKMSSGVEWEDWLRACISYSFCCYDKIPNKAT